MGEPLRKWTIEDDEAQRLFKRMLHARVEACDPFAASGDAQAHFEVAEEIEGVLRDADCTSLTMVRLKVLLVKEGLSNGTREDDGDQLGAALAFLSKFERRE